MEQTNETKTEIEINLEQKLNQTQAQPETPAEETPQAETPPMELAEPIALEQESAEPPVEETPPKKSRFPKPLRAALLYGGAGLLAIASGFGAGFLIHKMADDPQVIEIDAATLRIDEEALMKRYAEVKSYDELAPWEIANISLIKFARTSHHRFISRGSAVAMGLVTQNICSSGIRDEDEYFEESLSKSEGALDIQTGWRMYEHPDGSTDLYPSKANSISSDATRADWDSGKKEEYATKEAFKAVVGYSLSNHLSNYNITEYTYLKEGQDAPSGVPTSWKKTGDGYQLELELDVNLACEDYKVQMKHTSDLYGMPSFSFSHLSFVLDESLNIIEITSLEKYK
ncbi:MAG: hypothetical protein J6038_02400, partial [Bacilli bacterium]|nr:hypothetical protein [Bacilli bacterium]